jgi:hypothetical protein
MAMTLDPRMTEPEPKTAVESLSAQTCANIALASLTISGLLTLLFSGLYRATLL